MILVLARPAISVWRDAGGTWWRQGPARILVLRGALIMARGLLSASMPPPAIREAPGPGAMLLTLALSLAAQNAVTALRMQAGPPLAPGQPASQHPAPA